MEEERLGPFVKVGDAAHDVSLANCTPCSAHKTPGCAPNHPPGLGAATTQLHCPSRLALLGRGGSLRWHLPGGRMLWELVGGDEAGAGVDGLDPVLALLWRTGDQRVLLRAT